MVINGEGDPMGIFRPRPDVSGMTYPVRHTTCGKVHDAAKAEVLERYSDCTRWRCPLCKGICDDRAIGWGGNIEKLERLPASSTGRDQP